VLKEEKKLEKYAFYEGEWNEAVEVHQKELK
jgi:hypothetical protein